MKRIAMLAALVAGAGLFGLVPFESGDISEFCPVELLCAERRQDGVLIRTEGGLSASGEDLPEALSTLAETAPGRLLLDTVDYVVCIGLLPDATELLDCGLRPATNIYCAAETIEEPELLIRYLREHKNSLTLGELEDGAPLTKIPTLLRMGSGWRMGERR